MESKLNRQKYCMISLEKSKHTNVGSKKQNTWSNLLNKKSASTNTVIASKKKPKQNSLISERITKMKSQSDESDDLSNEKPYQSSSFSVFNPIRTLQFLLREVLELPSVQNTDIKKIIDEMKVVVERIANESFENVPYSKLHMPAVNGDSMIPTRENDYCKDLKYEYNPQEHKYWLVLLGKISELETSYSQLTKNYTKSEEKLLHITSERDKLIEKFKESCDSLEMLNNREREYLDTIMELKSKLIASEKLISKQEAIIINLNKRLSTLPIKNQYKEIRNMSTEQCNNTYKAVLKQNNEVKQNYNFTKLNLNNKSKITNEFKDIEVARLTSDIKQMKQIVLTGLENYNNKSVSTISMKSKGSNLIKDFTKYGEDNKIDIELDIDSRYTEYNRQASAIKLAKNEIHQLFEAINTQTHLSHKLFNSTIVNNDISDDEDNHSNITNFMSIVTESNC